MKVIKNNLESKKKEFSQIFFFSIAILFLLYYLISLFSDKQRELLKMQMDYYIIVAIISFYIGILITKLEYNFISFYRILLGLILVFVCYNTLLHCHLSVVAYFFFVPLIIFVSILYRKKTTIIAAVLFIVFIVVSKSIALALNISKPIVIPEKLEHVDLLNKIGIIVLTSYFSLFLIYYKKQFQKIQILYNNSNNSNKGAINILQDQYKFEELYNEIQKIIVHNKLFQDADFSKKKLAVILKTNETYISKALSLHGDKNFKSLINEYRIEQVLDDLNGRKYKKFTIEHIYSEAGFTQQSTFNRVFKEFTGKTPSLYIQALEEKKVN